MVNRLRFFLEKQPWSVGFALTIFERQENGRIAVCQSFEMLTQDEGTIFPAYAAIPFTEEAAQHLMDQLWEAGVRPAGNRDSTGQVAALNAHIADLRRIAFRVLKVE
jgi:hypothetical protein